MPRFNGLWSAQSLRSLSSSPRLVIYAATRAPLSPSVLLARRIIIVRYQQSAHL